MVRLRNKSGKCITLEGRMEMNFVEICGSDGKVAAVVAMDSPSRARLMQPGDTDFMSYLSRFGLSGAVVRDADRNPAAPPLQGRRSRFSVKR